MSSTSADLTPHARIRGAAVDLFGRQGFPHTTVRQVAAAAGVSPALVIHHYGTKERLRDACDDWIMRVLGSEKELLLATGDMPRMRTYLEAHPEFAPVAVYLVAALREGGEVATRIFDRLCAMTAEVLEVGRDAGAVRDLPDFEGAVPYLVAVSCGVMLMGGHVARHLGGTELTDPDIVNRYAALATDLFTHGLFTPSYGAELSRATDLADESAEELS